MNCELWREKCGPCMHLLCGHEDVDWPCDLENNPDPCDAYTARCIGCANLEDERGEEFFIYHCRYPASTNKWVEVVRGEDIEEALKVWRCPLQPMGEQK